MNESRDTFIMNDVPLMNCASEYQRSLSTFAENIWVLNTNLDNKLPPAVRQSFHHPYKTLLVFSLHNNTLALKARNHPPYLIIPCLCRHCKRFPDGRTTCWIISRCSRYAYREACVIVYKANSTYYTLISHKEPDITPGFQLQKFEATEIPTTGPKIGSFGKDQNQKIYVRSQAQTRHLLGRFLRVLRAPVQALFDVVDCVRSQPQPNALLEPASDDSPKLKLSRKSATIEAAILKVNKQVTRLIVISQQTRRLSSKNRTVSGQQPIRKGSLDVWASRNLFDTPGMVLRAEPLGNSETSFGTTLVRRYKYTDQKRAKERLSSKDGLEETPSFAMTNDKNMETLLRLLSTKSHQQDVFIDPGENNYMRVDHGQASPTGAYPLTPNLGFEFGFNQSKEAETAKAGINFQFVPVEINEPQTNEAITVAAVAADTSWTGPLPSSHCPSKSILSRLEVMTGHAQPISIQPIRHPILVSKLKRMKCRHNLTTHQEIAPGTIKEYDFPLNPLELIERNEKSQRSKDPSNDFTGLESREMNNMPS
ncbi:hypothetical protein RF11_10318 [Thelohanellus kitauei]|uniref:Uncharacterized protein n=1 Tax=Thelohanellus kitauei TaxID=669202 RepID=A0A0C2J9I4_THEKT|nr:hypothetical protein RF11_10318 [Thelohanellus kitauei]